MNVERYGKVDTDKEYALDEGAVKRRSERCAELAAMFKETGKGSMKTLYRIMARFRLQEGITRKVAKGYLDDLKEAGLVKVSKGQKRWRYDPTEEWDLFEVNIG